MIILNIVIFILKLAFLVSLVLLVAAAGDAFGFWEGWVSWA